MLHLGRQLYHARIVEYVPLAHVAGYKAVILAHIHSEADVLAVAECAFRRQLGDDEDTTWLLDGTHTRPEAVNDAGSDHRMHGEEVRPLGGPVHTPTTLSRDHRAFVGEFTVLHYEEAVTVREDAQTLYEVLVKVLDYVRVQLEDDDVRAYDVGEGQ